MVYNMIGPKSTQTRVYIVGIITDEMYPYILLSSNRAYEIYVGMYFRLLLFLLFLFAYFVALYHTYFFNLVFIKSRLGQEC